MVQRQTMSHQFSCDTVLGSVLDIRETVDITVLALNKYYLTEASHKEARQSSLTPYKCKIDRKLF